MQGFLFLTFNHKEPMKSMITKMNTLKTLLMLAVLLLASCESTAPEGEWDPMIWKADVPVQKADGFYQVPAAGAELIFSCQNYSFPWISDAESNGEYFFPPREENDFHTITTDWFRAEAKGNKLHVKFEANGTAKERTVKLTVTAGDIFYTFGFRQSAN